MKVQVTLNETATLKVASKSKESLRRYFRRLRLRNVNDRLLKYGVLSGDVLAEDDLLWLSGRRDVEAVEIDEGKSI